MSVESCGDFMGVLVCVAIIFAAGAAFTKRGRKIDDAFRRHWGGSDARKIDP